MNHEYKIIKIVLEKQDGAWTGFFWLRIMNTLILGSQKKQRFFLKS
jgi:hypothetical protein